MKVVWTALLRGCSHSVGFQFCFSDVCHATPRHAEFPVGPWSGGPHSHPSLLWTHTRSLPSSPHTEILFPYFSSNPICDGLRGAPVHTHHSLPRKKAEGSCRAVAGCGGAGWGATLIGTPGQGQDKGRARQGQEQDIKPISPCQAHWLPICLYLWRYLGV